MKVAVLDAISDTLSKELWKPIRPFGLFQSRTQWTELKTSTALIWTFHVLSWHTCNSSSRLYVTKKLLAALLDFSGLIAIAGWCAYWFSDHASFPFCCSLQIVTYVNPFEEHWCGVAVLRSVYFINFFQNDGLLFSAFAQLIYLFTGLRVKISCFPTLVIEISPTPWRH